MRIGKRSRSNRFSVLVLAGVVVPLLVSCGCLSGSGATPEYLQATAEAERILTATYGVEVRTQIENFESQWLSLEAHLDPSIQSEVATGPYLEYFGYARAGASLYDEPSWLVTTSAIVESLRVLEYSPERFKATACVVSTANEVTPEGVFLESSPPLTVCGVYVFVREGGVWKLAGFFNTADPRDWDYAQDWLKEIIGELPDNL